jgi:hypothetical protein
MVSANRSDGDVATQFILDMDTDDFIKACFSLEAQRGRSVRVEIARPAGNHLDDFLVRFLADESDRFVSGDTPQCLDLFAYNGR